MEVPTSEPRSTQNKLGPKLVEQGQRRHPQQQLANLAEIDVHTTPECLKTAATLLSEAAEEMTNIVII